MPLSQSYSEEESFESFFSFLEEVSLQDAGALVLKEGRFVHCNQKFHELLHQLPLGHLEQKTICTQQDGLEVTVLLFFKKE